MIFDTLKNKDQYINAHPLFYKAFEYIEAYLNHPIESGVYEIEGKDLFVKIQDYDTRTEGYLEVHKHYIDIQYMVEGTERVEYSLLDGLIPINVYDEGEDVQFLEDGKERFQFLLKPGNFAIFYPNDAHKPSMCIDKPVSAKKLVCKVRV